ncbi:CDGSH iron-sulfur domain-containing protein [Zhongshania sp.]|uniref:CDGSH iron-sulfur domain-containing protein n=1 Tax=Zhongshania sp. TaxID=1971902 RepID=UPI0039E57EA9
MAASSLVNSALCQCKATGNAPFCDGTHARLVDLKAGDETPRLNQQLLPQRPCRRPKNPSWRALMNWLGTG